MVGYECSGRKLRLGGGGRAKLPQRWRRDRGPVALVTADLVRVVRVANIRIPLANYCEKYLERVKNGIQSDLKRVPRKKDCYAITYDRLSCFVYAYTQLEKRCSNYKQASLTFFVTLRPVVSTIAMSVEPS